MPEDGEVRRRLEGTRVAKSFMSFTERDPQLTREEEAVQVVRTNTIENKTIPMDEHFAESAGMDAMSISAPKYTEMRNANIQVSYALIDETDYYYQIEMLKKPDLSETNVLGSIAQAFKAIVPDHIHVYISLPPADLDWPVFTVVAKKAASLMGAKTYMEEKLVKKLLELRLWG